MQQSIDIVPGGTAVFRTHDWLAYVERWSLIPVAPPGYVHNGRAYIFGSRRMPWGELLAVPQDPAELQRAEQAWLPIEENATTPDVAAACWNPFSESAGRRTARDPDRMAVR